MGTMRHRVPKCHIGVKGSGFLSKYYIGVMKWFIASVFLFPAWAIAQETPPATPVTPKSFAELYPPLPGVEYYCTNSEGQRVELGGVICVTASCTTWMARCEMAATNRMAIWRKTQDGCPGAALEGSVPGRLQSLKPKA